MYLVPCVIYHTIYEGIESGADLLVLLQYPSNALPLLKPVYMIEYDWTQPGVKSNQLKTTFPSPMPKHELEVAEGGALLRRWMLQDAVFARGWATPDFLAHIFGQ